MSDENSNNKFLSRSQHFILTHFNVKFKWSKGQLSTTGNAPTDEWFDHRLKLFDTYCYPSILNQTCQDFEWLIFFDDEATDKKKLEKYSRFTPVFVRDYKFWSFKHVIKQIRKRIKPKTKWLITTRFDCDDSLSINYINTMRNNISPEDMILNPTLGITYDIYKNKAYRYHYRCSNPFITTIEKITKNPLKTCFRDNHPRMRKYFKKFIQIQTKEPLWLQIIHDRNLGNTLRGEKIIPMTDGTLDKFHVNRKRKK